MRGYISLAAGAFSTTSAGAQPTASPWISAWGNQGENNNEFEHLNRRRAFRTDKQSRLGATDDQGFSSGSGMKPCSLRDLITPRIR